MIMNDAEVANKLVLEAKNKGLILFWLLIEKRAVRITPPLTISAKSISVDTEITDFNHELIDDSKKLSIIDSFHL